MRVKGSSAKRARSVGKLSKPWSCVHLHPVWRSRARWCVDRFAADGTQIRRTAGAVPSTAVSGSSVLVRLRARVRRMFSPEPSTTTGVLEPQVAWRNAIDGEVQFWHRFLETHGERYPGSYDQRLDPALPLQDEIAALIEAPEGATVRLLDVGAGPLTFLGRTHPGWTLEVTAVDALGEQY